MRDNPFQTPRIVQSSDGRPWVLVLLVLSLIAVVGWSAFEYGRRQAGYFSERSEVQREELERRLSELGNNCDQQRELAARYERASQIDRLAAEQVREDMMGLQQERADLRKKVAFLQSLISGEVTVLQVSEVELVRNGESNAYRFSFMVSKRAKGDEKVSGDVELAVAGKMGGKAATLKADKLGLDKSLKMGFKHFQKFEGVLQLPEDFVPTELVVTGQPDGKKFKDFEQRIKWPLG
jgi:hypothetical protein